MKSNDYYNDDNYNDNYSGGNENNGGSSSDNRFDYGEYHKSVVGDPFDDRMRKRYNELSRKQFKIAKIVMASVFSLMAVVWIIIGVAFKVKGISEEGGPPWYIFAGIGGVWLVIAVLIAVFMKAPSYDTMKKRAQKYYGYSSLDYGSIENKARTDVLEERVKELEEEVNRLKSEK